MERTFVPIKPLPNNRTCYGLISSRKWLSRLYSTLHLLQVHASSSSVTS